MALLEVQHLAKAFAGVQALQDVSLSVEAGEIVAVIGPNGAGKTTLLNTIQGFAKADSGAVRFDSVDLNGSPVHQRSLAGVARTFQTLQLFGSLTVWENLLVAAKRGRALGTAGELSRAAAAACGIEELLARRAGDLPLGEGRRVELARALCLRPKLMLLDEPVSGMNDTATAEMARLLLRLREQLGLGMLFIDHDMRFVMDVSDYVYVLDFGQVVAEGEPAEIRSNEEVSRAYVGSVL